MRDTLMAYLGLKDVLRQGWVNAGVEAPESVAAHSWGMAVLALKLCPEELNLEHVLKLCLVHDLPEVIVGDLTPPYTIGLCSSVGAVPLFVLVGLDLSGAVRGRPALFERCQ